LRRLEEEFEFGRIDQSRYTELKNKYQEELEKIWD
jgi:ribosomal protein S18